MNGFNKIENFVIGGMIGFILCMFAHIVLADSQYVHAPTKCRVAGTQQELVLVCPREK